MHPLVADGGEMTVLRDLAAFSYGRWSVDWPESVPDEQRPELPDDRDFGYASKLKKDPGRFGRRFVRADVTIKAQDFDEAGKPIPFSGESDVEQVLDDASTRTDGDVFFEREITRAGLGALQPRVDFDVDSIVPVLIWGKTIPSPVTSIEDVVEQGAVVDYRVHVGGQLLQDDAARERANREIERTIAQERRERLKDVGVVSRAASRAQSTADSAVSDVRDVRETLGGPGASGRTLVEQLGALNAQLKVQGEEPQPGLLPAYLGLNTRLWEQQEQINEARAKFEAQQKLINDQQKEINRQQGVVSSQNQRILAVIQENLRLQSIITSGMPRIVHIDTGKSNLWTSSSGAVSTGDKFGSVVFNSAGLNPRSSAKFTAKPGWVGTVLMLAVADDGNSDVTSSAITEWDRTHTSVAGGLYGNYKSATVFIFPAAHA